MKYTVYLKASVSMDYVKEIEADNVVAAEEEAVRLVEAEMDCADFNVTVEDVEWDEDDDEDWTPRTM